MTRRRFAPSIAGPCLVAALLGGACRTDPRPVEEAALPATSGIYVDRAAELGVDFVHFNGMTGNFLYPEMMGSGGAVFDYDGDGDLDLYLVQGAPFGQGSPLFPSRHEEPLTDRLYRNDLSRTTDGALSGRFVDRTELAGALASGYGMGAAVGDCNDDGWPDLYVTNLGSNALLHNLGDGTFADWTEPSGTGDAGWGVPAVFLDFDRDGGLDLFVGNYVEYTVAGDRACFGTTGARDYCGPTAYPGARDRLFRNLGGGRFAEVSSDVGVALRGRTLGAIASDFDGDGWPELYVANDGEPNFLWLNRSGRFEERALMAGIAVDAEGRPQASMGVESADFDNDGDEDLLLTHLTGEANTLYRNEGDGRFVDASRQHGLAASSLAVTGFGVGWLDYDLDGWLDALLVNGAVKTVEAQVRVGDPYPLKQPKQLLRGLGDGRFDDVSERAGEPFNQAAVGRGAAIGDLDGDGDPDALITNNNGPAELLIKQGPPTTGWVGISGPAGGFRARVTAGAVSYSARSRTDGSYASARDPRVVVGLGEWDGPVDLRLEIADRTILITGLPTRRYLVIRK